MSQEIRHIREVPVDLAEGKLRSIDARCTKELREFQPAVVAYAEATGWRAHAERAAWSTNGYRTPIMGSKGWPDLVLARWPRLVIAELKGYGDDLSAEQREWWEVLTGAPYDRNCPHRVYLSILTVEYHVFWPKDIERLIEVLR